MAADKQDKVLNFSSEREQSGTCSCSAEREKNQGKNFLNVPTLRFPEFSEVWTKDRIRNLFTINVGGDIDKKKVSDVKNEKYQYPVIANALSNEGILGYTTEYKDEPPCITVTGRGDVGYAKFRNFPLFPIVRLLVLHSKGKIDCHFGEYAINSLRKYEESTGVPQLTAPQLGAYSIHYPNIKEQAKIGVFLNFIDERIATQIRTIEKLQSLISGITQRVSKHSLIKMTLLSELLVERKEKNTALFPVHSVSVSEGVVNQIDYLGRSFAAADTSHYNVAHKGDIIYTKSPTGEFPFGIVKRNAIESNVAVSPLYGVYKPVTDDVAIYLHYYFCSPPNAQNYLHKLIQKGAKNTINITNQRFLENHIPLPDKKTLARFVKFTSAVSTKLRLEKSLLEALQRQKRYLLNSMFI